MTQSTFYPSLTYADAPTAIAWLCKVFGFTKRLVVPGPNGAILHSELSFGDGVIMVGSANPDRGRASPRDLAAVSQGICVHVDDPDAHFQRAVAGGASIIEELKDEDYGSRGYMAKDLEGHQWYFGTYRPGAHWTESAAS